MKPIATSIIKCLTLKFSPLSTVKRVQNSHLNITYIQSLSQVGKCCEKFNTTGDSEIRENTFYANSYNTEVACDASFTVLYCTFASSPPLISERGQKTSNYSHQ